MRDLPRSGRPKVYTDDIFQQCLDIFTAQEPEGKWTTRNFFESLKVAGVVHPTADKYFFLRKWKAWLRGRNLHIDYYSTKEVFKIMEEDMPKRLEYAKGMLKIMEDNPNMEFVFLDETSMEHGQHPKTGGLSFLMY